MPFEKDRQSRMSASSINAPSAKGGAGGAFTWGSPMDNQEYQPVGVQHQTLVVANGYSAPTGSVSMAAPVALQANIKDAQQFPALSMQSPRAGAQPPVNWGPNGMQITIATRVRDEHPCRTGAPALFDSSHPRNTFAKKPHTAPVVVQQPAGSFAMPHAIDWSATGTAAHAQQVIQSHASANPAHLSVYQAAQPSPSMATLQQQAPPQQYVPKMQKHVNTKPQYTMNPMVMQARAR